MDTQIQNLTSISLFVYDAIEVTESCGVWLPLGLLIAHTKNGSDTMIPIAEYRALLGDNRSTDEDIARCLVTEGGYASVEVMYVSYHYVPSERNEDRAPGVFDELFEEGLQDWISTREKKIA